MCLCFVLVSAHIKCIVHQMAAATLVALEPSIDVFCVYSVYHVIFGSLKENRLRSYCKRCKETESDNGVREYQNGMTFHIHVCSGHTSYTISPCYTLAAHQNDGTEKGLVLWEWFHTRNRLAQICHGQCHQYVYHPVCSSETVCISWVIPIRSSNKRHRKHNSYIRV